MAVWAAATDEPPLCTMPKDSRVPRALNTEALVDLAYNRFLASNKGYGAQKDAAVIEVVAGAGKLRQFIGHKVGPFVAAYLQVARAELGRRLQGQAGVKADALLFDASRVAGLEVLLVHAFVEDLYCCAPLQVLADQPGARSGPE
eukprot:7392604-Alexandrium_andersonii.AAC.1